MPPSRRKDPKAARSRRKAASWETLPQEELLDLRLCDLPLRVETSPLGELVDKVHEELRARDIRILPHVWLSGEWFTPEGATGIAVPFYLAHPRLLRLERSLMGEVEGGTREWNLKLLRHETGHVVDHAFHLHRRRRWQRLFGLSSRRYPRFYRPNPQSRRYVQHLAYWYAQSHPDEDFAETFAVWLPPRSNWRTRYRGWPALRKLLYVDELMDDIAGRPPRRRTRRAVEPLSSLRLTLRTYYERKLRDHEKEYPDHYDQDLRQLFGDRPGRNRRKAAALLRELSPSIRKAVAPWIGEDLYLLDHVLRDLTGRCRELGLYAPRSGPRFREKLMAMVAKHVVTSLYRNRRWLRL